MYRRQGTAWGRRRGPHPHAGPNGQGLLRRLASSVLGMHAADSTYRGTDEEGHAPGLSRHLLATAPIPGSPEVVLSRPRGGARWYRKPRPRNHPDGASSTGWTRVSPRAFTGTWRSWPASADSCSGTTPPTSGRPWALFPIICPASQPVTWSPAHRSAPQWAP